MKNIFKGSPDESLGFLFSRVYTLRQKRMNDELASIGINYVQYNLLTGLYWLQLHGNTINQMMLIDYTKLDKSVVSNILHKMVKEEYIVREESVSDTRAKIVTLTPKGEKLVEQANQIVSKIDETFWGNIPQKSICQYLCEVVKINS
ncbi:MAG: MarR family winged helix-turn-helix transcriptional regulator [Prevotella sp.]|jgi:DNA-binding MarR family transcriptional regulator|nr:MarR family winged helix-turn-helix transcriptional regulator [Prevotella sp.]